MIGMLFLKIRPLMRAIRSYGLNSMMHVSITFLQKQWLSARTINHSWIVLYVERFESGTELIIELNIQIIQITGRHIANNEMASFNLLEMPRHHIKKKNNFTID